MKNQTINKNLELFSNLLKDLGLFETIDVIKLVFQGCGDSGGVDEILYCLKDYEKPSVEKEVINPFNEARRTALPDNVSALLNTKRKLTSVISNTVFNMDKIPGKELVYTEIKEVEEEISITTWLENLCYTVLELLQPGWEINEGSQGEIVYDVKKNTLTVDIGINYMEVVEKQYVFNSEQVEDEQEQQTNQE